MKEFIGYLTGEESRPLFAACMFFALLLSFISLRQEFMKRDKLSKNTPDRFSARWLLLDNIWRLLTSLAIIYVFVRFGRKPLFNWLFPGSDTTEGQFIASGVIGYLGDRIALWLKKLGFLANKVIRNKFRGAGLTDEEQDQIERP